MGELVPVSIQRISEIIALVVLLAVSGSPSSADDIPPCSPPSGVASVKIPDAIPVALRQDLRKSLGEIALPGQSFNATDVIIETVSPTGERSSAPARRFIFVWHFGDRWLVATEHGGIAYNDPVFLFRIGNEHDTPQLMRTEIAEPPTVCATAVRMIRQ